MIRPRVNLRRAALLFNPLKKMLGDLDIDIAMATAIVSRGAPSAYALVWEYGNVRQTKKGPKTTHATDIETGKKVWLTIQAPKGYVRVLRPRFRKIIEQELGKVKFGKKDTKKQIASAWDRVGERIVALVKEKVPVGDGTEGGALRDSITWIKPRQAKTLKQALAGVKGNG